MILESLDDNTVVASPPPSHKEQVTIFAISAGLGASAGWPYASPAYRAASGHPALGVMFATSTFIAYGAASTWGWHHLLTEFKLKYRSGEFYQSNAVLARAAGACVMACFAGGMNFAIAHRYNDKSLFFPAMAFVNWYGLDASGYYKIIGFVSGMTPLAPLRGDESEWEQFVKKAIMVFPVGNLIVNSYLAIKAGKEFTGDDFAAMPFAALALSTFALDIFSAYELVEQVFSNRHDADLVSQYSALTQLIFKVLSLTIVLFATSSDGFIAADTFNHSVVGDVLAGLAIGSGFILGNYLLDDLTKQMFFHRKPILAQQHATLEEQPLLESNGHTSSVSLVQRSV
jgi:hypothetical protein